VLEKAKKILRDDKGVLTPASLLALKKELGDVFYYLVATTMALSITLEDIIKTNVEKIRNRVEKGTIEGHGDDR